MTRGKLRGAARRILRAGLAAVEPGGLVRAHLAANRQGIHVDGLTVKGPKRVFVVSVGKAAVAMARAAHRILGARITSAIVIAPQAAPRMPRTVSLVCGHPIPDAAGIHAGKRVIQLLEKAERDDLVLLLLSGGASALMPAPVDGVSLVDKQRVTRLLLRRGATITEINAVRKQLSRLKGGGFARMAAPAQVITLALSDVSGDVIGAIGSGPTVADPRAGALARRTVRTLLKNTEVPPGIRRALRRPGVKSAVTSRTRTLVIGSGRTFAVAAAGEAREIGFRVRLLPGALRGEARLCGPALVGRFDKSRGRSPFCLIATGETVVKVLGEGVGGRNQELALSAIPSLARLRHPAVLVAFATDGADGRSAASGGLVDDGTEYRAIARGVSVQTALNRNDSTKALRRLGSLIVTGPTGTNVADIALILG